MDRKCWLAGHESTGYLLYFAETRGKAREQMAGTLSIDFYDSLWADVRRVSGLDGLSDGVLDDRMAFLYAGLFGECRFCHVEISLGDDYQDPYWVDVLPEGITGPYCHNCACSLADGDEDIRYLSRDEMLEILRVTFRVRDGV